MIRLKNVSKFYYNKGIITSGFTKVNLEFNVGEFVVITGESGSGKSTLLNVISGLDTYEEGEMYIDGQETSHYTEQDFEEYRNKYIGNIFQNFNLVNSYTVYQNIELVLLINGYDKEEAKPKVKEIIKRVGLSDFEDTKVSKLSGGQKQRVAIARALAKETDIVVADEPTGNLDSESAKAVIEILSEISKGKLVIVVTHNYEQFEKYATRRIKMNDGRVTEDEVIVATDNIEAEKPTKKHIKTGQISRKNRLMLGGRNAFNIVPKFVLLLVVFMFLIFAVGGQYGSLKKNEADTYANGRNGYFTNSSETRIVLNKDNKEVFTKADYNAIKDIPKVESVAQNDIIQDIRFWIEGEQFGLDGYIKSNEDLDKKVQYGKAAKDAGEVVMEVNGDNFYFNSESRIEAAIGTKITLQDYTSGTTSSTATLTVVGIVVNDNLPIWEANLYGGDDIVSAVKLNSIKNVSEIKVDTGKQVINVSRGDMALVLSSKVPQGTVYTSESIGGYFDGEEPTNKEVTVETRNIYGEGSKKLKIDKLVTKNNLKNLLGLENFDENSNNIYINPQDLSELIGTGDYQYSVFVKDVADVEETVSKLNEMGYNPLPLKDAKQTSQIDEIMFKIIKVPMIMFMILTMFFIAYFVIKLILRSRSGYFVILRVLGMNRKNAKKILDTELLIDANVAFGIFLIAYAAVKAGLIKIAYLVNLVNMFTAVELICLYAVVMAMVYLISSKFAKGLFKKSAMNTFREEV